MSESLQERKSAGVPSTQPLDPQASSSHAFEPQPSITITNPSLLTEVEHNAGESEDDEEEKKEHKGKPSPLILDLYDFDDLNNLFSLTSSSSTTTASHSTTQNNAPSQAVDLDALRKEANENLAYLAEHLPHRKQVYLLHRPESLMVIKVQRLLRQHQVIADALKRQEQDPKRWGAFCRRAGWELFKKGYYQPENWLTTSALNETNNAESKQVPSSNTLTDRIFGDPRLWEYYQEVTTRLSDILLAVKAIRSGLVPTTKTLKDTAVTIGSKLVSIGLKAIPAIGDALDIVPQIIELALTTVNELSRQRNAARLARWCITHAEAEQLIESLALQLLPWRESALVMNEFVESSLLQRAENLYRQIKEATDLSAAQKLALQDIAVLTQLMVKTEPTKSPFQSTRVAINSHALLHAFGQHEKISVPEIKESIAPAETKQLPSTNPFTRHLPNATYYWHGATHNVTTAAQKALQAASNKQAIADEKTWLRLKWEDQQYALEQPELSNILELQQAMLQGLAFSLDWTVSEQEIVLNQMQKLWETFGLTALTHAVQTSQTQPWEQWKPTHQRLLQLLRELNYLEPQQQAKSLAETLRNHYRTVLLSWSQENIQDRIAQEKHLQEAKETASVSLQRYHSWHQRLADWLETVGPAAPVPPPLFVNHLEAADPTVLGARVAERWHHDDFKTIETLYAEYERAWKDAVRQGRDTAGALHSALVSNLKAAQQRLDTVWEKQQQDHAAEQQHLQEAHDQVILKHTQLDKALKEAEQLKAELSKPLPPHTSATPLKEDKSLSLSEKKTAITSDSKTSPAKESITQPFWQDAADAVHAVEQRLGTAPCGFSVITWNNSASGTLLGQWQWGLLLASPTSGEQDNYWHVFCHLLNRQLINLSTTPIGLQWLTPDLFLITDDNLTPYRQNAHCFAISRTQAETATGLWSTYKDNAQRQQQASSRTTGVPLARQWGYDGLQSLNTAHYSKTNLTAENTYSVAERLLYPLLHWCQYVGSYYGLAPASPDTILNTLVRDQRCHPGFITDIRNAIHWAETHLSSLAHAWRTQQPPRNLAPGEVILLHPDSPAIPAEQNVLRQHHRYTVALLAHTQKVWGLHTPPVTNFDPLQVWFDQTLLNIKHRKIPETAILSTLPRLVTICAHRHWKNLKQQLEIFWDIPQDYRSEYVRLFEHALPEQKTVTQQLRLAPNHVGWRLITQEQQRRWQDSLRSLVAQAPVPNLPDSAKTDIAEGKAVWVQWVENHQSLWAPLKAGYAKTLLKLDAKQIQWQPKTNAAGNHRVYQLKTSTKCFWAKIYPEQPGMGHLVTSLDHRLGVERTPQQQTMALHHAPLIVKDGTAVGMKITQSAIVVSEHVADQSQKLQTILEKQPQLLAKLDFISFIKTFLRVLLSNPEDDKADDYFLVPIPGTDRYQLIRIDNERAFLPVSYFSKGWIQRQEKLQVKSILYCLDQMLIPWDSDSRIQELLEDLRQLQPSIFIIDLLQEIDDLHNDWQHRLFPLETIYQHACLQEPWLSLPTPMLPQGIENALLKRFTSLQTALRSFQTRDINGLKLLEIVQPELAKFYNISLFQGKLAPHAAPPNRHAHARFERVAGPYYQQQPNQAGGRTTRITGPMMLSRLSSIVLPEQPKTPTEREQVKTFAQNIWEKKANSVAQALAAVEHWRHEEVARVAENLLANKTDSAETAHAREKARIQFGLLPGPEQQRVLEKVFAASGTALTLQEQHYLLTALIGAQCHNLDFRPFEAILTNELLLPILRNASKQILKLNLSDCTQLTSDILKDIERYCPYLKRLQINGQTTWKSIDIGNFAELTTLECNQATL